eukprot:403356964
MGACQNSMATLVHENKSSSHSSTVSSFELLKSYKDIQQKESKTKVIKDLKITKQLFVTTKDQKFQDNYKLSTFLGEDILRQLDHPNIIKLFEIYEDSRNFYLVQELVSGGELFEELIKRKKFNEKDAAQIISKVLSAVSYCHENNVIHRDIKPENILIDWNNDHEIDVKLIDFGASLFHNPKKFQTEKFGTVYYVAPEVLLGHYDKKCDVWSIGVVLFVLLSGEAPFQGAKDFDILEQIKTGKFEFKSPIWAQRSGMCKDMIKTLLHFDYKTRIDCTQALDHPWIKQKVHLELSKMHLSMAFKNMQRFSAKNKLQEAAMTYIVFQLTSADEQEDMIKSFRKFDKNGNGSISHLIWSRVDLDGNGKIDFTEWEVATINKKDALTTRKLKKAFDMFDLDKSGSISALELKKAMGSFVGDLISDNVWKKMIAEVDKNGNGEIDFEEFAKMMQVLLDQGNGEDVEEYWQV